MKQYLYNIKDDFINWLDKSCNANELLNYEVDYYKRHFKLENGKIYFLNSYIQEMKEMERVFLAKIKKQ